MQSNKEILDWIVSQVKPTIEKQPAYPNHTIYFHKYMFDVGQFRLILTCHDVEYITDLSTIYNMRVSILEKPIIEDSHSTSVINQDNKAVTINLNVVYRIAPNPVFPENDSRFESFDLAKRFTTYSRQLNLPGMDIPSHLDATPDEICKIMIFCDKLSGLKAFW